MISKLGLLLNLCFYLIVKGSEVNIVSKENEENTFPPEFSFGVATAAYQIEGGWNADGKGPSIWDTFTHEHPEMISDKSNADVGPDSYNLFEEDLRALKELGVDFYRFSISWSRILPKGDISSINSYGIIYYNNIINKLIESGITPVVTMYHFDLPHEVQKIGGFANPLFVKYFEAYADVLFSNFGDRVKMWITINEPYNFCVPGYGKDYYPPLVNASGIGEYLCIDHTIKAHALAYRLYKSKYFKKQKGRVGITLSSRFFYSKTNNTEMVDRAIQFMLGWVANPIFSKEGGYPDVMVEDIAKNSLKEGRAWSRLPTLEGQWKELIRNSSDFLGLNYYTARLVKWAPLTNDLKPSIEYDSKVDLLIDEKWKRAKSNWLYYVPRGLGDILRWVRDNYNNVEVIITENGWSDDGQLDDTERIYYLKNHLREVLGAINSGCNISGYTFWSLIDNFEWRQGFTEKFGLYAVNLESPGKERIPKKSASIYKSIIKSRKILD